MNINIKQATALIAIAAVVIISGCADTAVTDKKANKLSGEVDTSDAKVGETFWTEMRATEANHQSLVKAEPIPKMEDSLERENLIRRYRTLNDQNEVFHVYLMSHGKVVSYFTAQGKVSSVNSKLTQPEQLVACNRGGDDWDDRDDDCVVSSPQLDGSYGTNGDAIFFFTTDGSYVEWNGQYVVSERPLSIQTPLTLETQVNTTQ